MNTGQEHLDSILLDQLEEDVKKTIKEVMKNENLKNIFLLQISPTRLWIWWNHETFGKDQTISDTKIMLHVYFLFWSCQPASHISIVTYENKKLKSCGEFDRYPQD